MTRKAQHFDAPKGYVRYPGLRYLLLAWALLCVGTHGVASALSPGALLTPLPTPLRTLTTAHEAHSLTLQEAARSYPVHLRAVVTYFDAYLDPRHLALFVHDASGGIFVSAPSGSVGNLSAGSLVDITGVSGTGDFAPIVAQPHITVIGRSEVPATAPRVSLTRLLTGAEDSQWVEVSGVVRSFFDSGHNVTLRVALSDGTVSATTIKDPHADYARLIDAEVTIHADAGPVFNGNGQLVGARLLFPDLTDLKVVRPAFGDPFRLPVRPVKTLLQFDPAVPLAHRVHIRGRVTLQWPGWLLCLRDATQGLCAETAQASRLDVGDMVDVIGFPATSGNGPELTHALFQRAASGAPAQPAVPLPVTADQALMGKYDSELVEIDGQLLGRDLAAPDTTLMLASGKDIFAAILPKGITGSKDAAWRDGSRLRLIGICSVQVDAQKSARAEGSAIPASFRIRLRSPRDVVVLQGPSWWTPRHAVIGLTLALSATLMVLGWVVALRKRVERQTKVIRGSEERFRHLAQHDALTGLPSRLLLHDRLNAALERSRRYQTGLGLLMLDLDEFKLINDSLGHHAGDDALRITAQRIVQVLRKSDTVARMGGDEFIVLLPDLDNPAEAETVAKKIVEALAVPIPIGDREVSVSVSVGVCTSIGGALDADTMLKSVDTAMYYAKAQGRNCFQTFTADMARATVEKLRLRAGLGRALELNELELHYQPMVSFKTGELTGFEALLRWRSKGLGLVMPGDFIALAEESGLIVPIGEWVLREACREIGSLESRLNRTFMLAVNLSPRQFQQNDLPRMIEGALADYGRLPDSIEFEVTESLLMSDSSRTRDCLLQLRDMGVRLAIDDFGIGFSSLSYITRFSIDRIKIDRSFIENCIADPNSLAVVRAIVAMAHGLRIQVVAEGVETEEQFLFLQREGCDTAQGYYLSRPVPGAQLPALLRTIEETLKTPVR